MARAYIVTFLDGIGPLRSPVRVPAAEAIFWATVGDCLDNCRVTLEGDPRLLMPEDIREHEITASRIRDAFKTINERRRSA